MIIAVIIRILVITIMTTMTRSCGTANSRTPSSHHNIFPHTYVSKGWVAQKPFVDRQFDGGAKTFQGLRPKRPESCDGNWVQQEAAQSRTRNSKSKSKRKNNNTHNTIIIHNATQYKPTRHSFMYYGVM